MPQKIELLTKSDVRDIVVKELKKKNKIISKGEVRVIAEQVVIKNNSELYRYLNRLRKRIAVIEKELKISKFKFPIKNA